MHLFRLGWLLLALAAVACTGPEPARPVAAPGTAALATATAAPGVPGLALLPIAEHDRYGFIDSTGRVVVAPRFAQAQEFSEGLAAGREGGRYGYLDASGAFVLPARYAYATPFRQGLAVAYPDSLPQLIDRAGRAVPLPAAYTALRWLPAATGRGGVWVGELPHYKRQLLNARGQLLTPAQFERVDLLSDNRLVVTYAKPAADPDNQPAEKLTGVLDGRGRLVVPYRRFDYISQFRHGLAAARLYQTPDSDTPARYCLLDTTGRILYRLPRSQDFPDDEQAVFSDGVVVVRVSQHGSPVGSDNYFLAPLDSRGHLLFRNPHLRELSAFRHGRAWAQEENGNWFLLNRAGRRLSSVAVRRRLRPGRDDEAPHFAAGAEVVELAGGAGYAALDSTGRVVRRLPAAAGGNEPRQVGELLLFYGADSLARQGFWNWRTGLLVPPRFEAIHPAGYRHGLLAVAEAGRLGYLSPAGRYVWRAAAAQAASTALNLDYQRRSGYPVASPAVPRYGGLGGWGPSSNLPRPVPAGQFPGRALTVRVAAAPQPNALGPQLSGHPLTIANTSADTVVFEAQNSCLDLTVQAQDAQGRWRGIEYQPSSFCGNSYHQVFLAPGRCWQLVVPAYQGAQRTQLRVRLRHRRAPGARGPQVAVYSNPFAGSVNPAQFWRREGYAPQGIMDPYWE